MITVKGIELIFLKVFYMYVSERYASTADGIVLPAMGYVWYIGLAGTTLWFLRGRDQNKARYNYYVKGANGEHLMTGPPMC